MSLEGDSTFPVFLTEQSYERVAREMLAPRLHRKSAALPISDEGFNAYLDTSLTRQLHQLTRSATPPEAYCFTAFSAVPIADAVRGYYSALDQPIPSLQVIYANRRQAAIQHTPKGQEYTAQEVERLSTALSYVSSVAIVDQLVISGSTFKYAASMLNACGIDDITVVQGRWYHDCDPEDTDITAITSIHQPFMHQVGIEAAGIPIKGSK